MRPAISISAAAIIVVTGLLALEGCIFIPTFNNADGGKNASKLVGVHGSDRPLRVDTATKLQIENALGISYWRSNRDGSYSYRWFVQNGIWVYPFCFQGIPQHGVRTITFRFDESGVLRSFKITAANDDGDYLGMNDPENIRYEDTRQ